MFRRAEFTLNQKQTFFEQNNTEQAKKQSNVGSQPKEKYQSPRISLCNICTMDVSLHGPYQFIIIVTAHTPVVSPYLGILAWQDLARSTIVQCLQGYYLFSLIFHCISLYPPPNHVTNNKDFRRNTFWFSYFILQKRNKQRSIELEFCMSTSSD